MTSKDIIRHLEKIKGFCQKHEHCDNCPFVYGINGCQINSVAAQLNKNPEYWDMEVIKEIINE